MDAKNYTKRAFYAFLTIIFLFIVFYFTNSSRSLPKPSDQQLCYGSGDFVWKISACWNLIRRASERYEELQKEMATNSLIASGARQQIIRSRDEFYNNTLSGVNINF